MILQTTIDLRALAAIACAASKEETRYYLKGVCITASKETVEYAATDGHILLATRRELEQSDFTDGHGPLVGTWIVPTEICTHFKLLKSIAKMDQADLSQDKATPSKLTLTYDGKGVTFEPVDGTFPDWRRVVPSSYDGTVAQFDPAMLMRFVKASKILGGTGKIAIAHNGGGPALVGLNCSDLEAFGVIMPFRGAGPCARPAWIHNKG